MAEVHPISTNPRFHNLIGKRFTRLLVVNYAGQKNHTTMWHCRCDCGKEKTVAGISLTRGRAKSCGCLRSEQLVKRFTKHGMSSGGRIQAEFRIWIGLIRRCTDPNDVSYPLYGGRGIKVCRRWLESAANFVADMGLRPSRHHSIDRIDNNGDYEPGNCRWATRVQQARNTRRSRMLTFRGVTKPLPVWAEEVGISQKTLASRLNLMKWSVEEALTRPIRKQAID